jgi:hypothetical protein
MTEHTPEQPGRPAVTEPAAPARPSHPVPAGPGVVPPFPAPPVEGRTARVWLGLGVGALVAVLVCGGGLAAVAGLLLTSTKALNEEVSVVVGDYFAALRDRRYDQAYKLLCDSEQAAQSPSEFADKQAAQEHIRSYRVGTLSLGDADTVVPVVVVHDDGSQATVQVHLDQDRDTGEFEVCGVQE